MGVAEESCLQNYSVKIVLDETGHFWVLREDATGLKAGLWPAVRL